ncbi:MAG: hypothetical protein HRU20_06460 [Pseudomonadales bacterium]|nr:hypothetical protein [Pseudomonadales bacterium]
MVVKISLLLLALLNGGWMLFDGMHVMRKGKYFGPEEPGIWSKLVASFGINPFSMGPVFVALGLFWFVSVAALLTSMSWGWLALMVVAIATLWYVKVGTAISIIVMALLLIFKQSLGYA